MIYDGGLHLLHGFIWREGSLLGLILIIASALIINSTL